MARRALIVLAALMIAFAAFILVHHSRSHRLPPEPVWGGKPLSAWLVDLDYTRRPADVAASNAVSQMGTNVLPFLLPMFQAHDSPLKLKLIQFARRQSIWKVNFTSADVIRQRASCACRVFGPAAREYIPELNAMQKSPDTYTAWCGLIAVLGCIKPIEESIPELTRGLSSPVEQVRWWSAEMLGTLRERASNTIPVVMLLLDDNSLLVREGVSTALVQIETNHVVLADRMAAMLSSTNRQRRITALRTLEQIPREAAPFAEQIRELEQADDSGVRLEAHRVLRKLNQPVD